MGSSSLKTLWVFPSLREGLRYWAVFFCSLQKADIQVSVLTVTPPEKVEPDLRLKVIPGLFRTIKRQSATDPYGADVALVSPRLILDVLHERPDVVVAIEYSLATFWSAIACRLLGIKLLIFTEHWPVTSVQRSALKGIWRRFLARIAHGFVANTSEAREYVVKGLGARESQVFLTPIVSPPAAEQLCKLGAPLPELPQRPVFLFVGRLIPQKGVECLLAAAAILHGKGYRFCVWIVGEGIAWAGLLQWVEVHGLADVVRFFGHVPYEGIGSFYAKSDAFVLPTRQDYFPVAVLEAMSFGLPVLVSKHAGSAGSMVHHGENGFVFDPDHPQELGAFMEQLIREPEMIKIMGEDSKAKIAPYTQGNAVRLFEKAVRTLIQAKRHR